MLNLAPTEEQEEIRNLAHTLAVEQLRPEARSAEKRGGITLELMHTLMQTGITTPYPESLGGSGASAAVTYALIAEELGFGDGGLEMNSIGWMMGPVAVLLAGDENQQGHYITPFCDEQEGYMRYGSFAFAEHTGGYSLEEISATVRKEGEHYIINGAKRDVIHGGHAHPPAVPLPLEGTTGTRGLVLPSLPGPPQGMPIINDIEQPVP